MRGRVLATLAALFAALGLGTASYVLMRGGPRAAGALTLALAFVALGTLAFLRRMPEDVPPALGAGAPPRTAEDERLRWGAILGIAAAVLLCGHIRAYAMADVAYALIGLGGGLVAWDILRADDDRSRTHAILRLSLLWVAILVAKQLPFPRGMGSPDLGTHLSLLIDPILRTGHIPPGESYTAFPMHHLMVAAATLLSGSEDPRKVYALVGTLLAATLPLASYLIAKPLGERVGAVAALLVPVLAYAVNIATHPSPVGFAAPYALLALGALAPGGRRAKVLPLALAGGFALVAAGMHPYSAAIFLAILGGLLFVDAARGSRRERIIAAVLALMVGAAFVALLVASGTWELAFVYMKRIRDPTRPGVDAGASNYYDTLPTGTLLANLAPIAVLLALGLVGAVWLIARRRVPERILLSIALAAATTAGLAGVPLLLADRWYLYFELLCLPIFAAFAILLFARTPRRAAVAAVAIGVLFATAPATFVAGAERSYLSDDVLRMRTFLTPEEAQAADWIAESGLFAYNVPGCLHERAELFDLTRISTFERARPNWTNTQKPALLMVCEHGRTYGVPAGALPGDRVGGTLMARLDTSTLEAGEVADRVLVSANTAAYRVT